MRLVRVLLGLAAALLPQALAAAPPMADTFSDTAEVLAVEIPVQVLLDGKPVRGLTAESFAVYQKKERQPVTGFEAVDLLTLPGEKAEEVPAPARRHFLFLFDLSFSEPKAIVQARAAAKDLLAGLHPSDVVAVATYAASRGPELVLGFTPDRVQAEAAIDTLGLPELIDRTPDPLRLVVDDARQGAAEAAETLADAELSAGSHPSQGPTAAQAARAIGDLEVLDQMERAERSFDRADIEDQKRKVAALARSFTDLARLMRSVQGRKYVVYLSEGFDSSILTGTLDKAELAETQDAGEKGRLWEVSSEQRFGHGSAVNDVTAMLQELRRADCIVQSVDIGGLRAGSDLGHERRGGRDTLFQMARDTGGDLFENFNDLSSAMGQMLERTSVTYVLTIQPEAAPDGSYHELEVKLVDGPRGARVVHRPGYFAPRPFAERSRFEKMLLTAGQVLLGDEGGAVRASLITAPLQAFEDESDVPFVVEIDGASLLQGHVGEDMPAEIYVYAMDGKGAVRDYMAQTLVLDLGKVEGALRQSGLRFYGHLELPPGSYKARLLVRNGRTGAYALRVVPVEVPDYAEGGPLLLPPLFPAAPGDWLLTREAPRPGRREVPLPFRLEGRPFLPAARPILAGGEEARFALMGYNLGEGELTVRSQVLTADGRELERGDLAVVHREPEGGGQAERLELSFRPPALQPGEYLLRVTVTGEAGRTETVTAPFAVAAELPAERS